MDKVVRFGNVGSGFFRIRGGVVVGLGVVRRSGVGGGVRLGFTEG